MRITNSMMTNNILLNLNRNRKTMANYEEQMSSGKKIQKPSDNPIIAARALKLRTNVSEISQYKTNVKDALSWLEITEQAITNTTDMLQRINTLSNQGATGTLTAENRASIATEISELRDQIVNEANVSYAGRYVFGGYQTDKALVFDKPSTDSYAITEHFDSSDMETVKRVYDNGTGPAIHEVSRIRLGYSDVTDGASLASDMLGAGYTVEVIDSTTTTPLAYEPASTVPPTVHFLQDTGELIFNSGDQGTIETDFPTGFDFTYQKDGFAKNDLKPDHFFNSTNITTGDVYTVREEAMNYQISYSQSIQVNVMGESIFSPDMIRDLEEIVKQTNNIESTPAAGNPETINNLKKDLLGESYAKLLTTTDYYIENNSNVQAKVGGKVNRLDLTLSRLEEDELNFTDLLSENEDADVAETLIKFSAQEVVYNAALASSSKVIQNTLLDFLR